MGGVAIFFGFTFACLIWTQDAGSSQTFPLLPILIIPFIIGLLDDLVHLKPVAKLLAQGTTASLLFFILDMGITSSYGLLADHAFPTPISYAVTVFTVIIITNSLNLIDGIDGLAAAFSLIACLFFGAWFLMTGYYPYALLCLALAGGILAFLFKNWEPSNIFMGDTGSMVIGTLLSVIAIDFVNRNHALPDSDPLKFSSSLTTAACALIIPLVDTVRIIIIRLSKGISPLVADKRHIHHGLLRLGFTHERAVYFLACLHVGMIGVAIAFRHVSEAILLPVVVLIATALCLWLQRALVRAARPADAKSDKSL